MEKLDASTSGLRDFDLQARFAAELSLYVLDGEAGDPAVAVEAMKAIPSAGLRTFTTAELAEAHTASGRLEDADAILRFGLEHDPEPTTVPRLWYARAEVARVRGNWELVETCLASMETSFVPDATYEGDPKKAPFLRENHEYRSRLCQARAQALLALGLLDQCGPLVREAIEEAKKSGDPSTLVSVNLLAFDRALLSGSGEEEALALVEENLKNDQLSPWHPLLRVAKGIALLEQTRDGRFRGGDIEKTAADARTALEVALSAGLPVTEQLKAENGLCDLELVVGRPDDARTHLERARKLVVDLGPSSGPANEGVYLAMLAWRLASLAGGAKEEERARCRKQLIDAYGRFLAEWESTPRRAGGIGFLQVDWRTQLLGDVIEAELSATPGPEGVKLAFERLLAAQAMGTEAREHELAPVDLATVRSTLLAEGRGLLVLLPARDSAHLFALDRKAIVHAKIPVDRQGLRARAREITAELQNPDGAVDAGKLRALSDELLPPAVVERLAGWTSAITVGFDMLRDLPFGILTGKDGKPQARRLALCSLPSVVLGVELARRGRRHPSDGKDLVLVVANDPPRELSPPFRFEKKEREQLLDPFHGRTLLLEKKDASRSALLARRAELAGASVLHFLMHGTALPGREFSSALVLSGLASAPECFFTAEDVAQLELDAGLVILSSCGSGRGPARTGDDRLVHLGGAFLDAGAGCVVLARFPVDYETTLALMQRLHERLAAGDSPAEALRAARADGIAAYHDAAFEVLGLGFEAIFARSR